MSNTESFIKYTNLMQMLATLKIPYEEISNACEISTEMFLQKLNVEASFTLHEAQTIKCL